MRALPVLLIIASVPAAAAHPKHPAHSAHAHSTRSAHAHARPAPVSSAPTSIGTWNQWSAATHAEGGQLVCYAFARAASPAAPDGGNLLTVTQRPSGRDAVAITAGYTYPKGAAVDVQVAGTKLPFYAVGSSAFARDGRAAVAAFRRGRDVRVRAPAARGGEAVDTFSLAGFDAAYAAVSRRCPG
jgi:hypothetical protein